MGAASTVGVAGTALAGVPPPAANNITVAVSQHAPSFNPATTVSIPIMFTAGTADTICTDKWAKELFGQVGSGIPKVLLDVKGTGHFDPTDDTRRAPDQRQGVEDGAVALFLTCWLRGEECDKVYGPSGNAICSALPTGHTAATCTVEGGGPPVPPAPLAAMPAPKRRYGGRTRRRTRHSRSAG